MSKHEDLIKTLRASAAAMPFGAAVAVQYRAIADALEAQAREIEATERQVEILADALAKSRREIEGLRKDAERYAVVRRGQHWSVIDGIGDPLTGDALDAGVDAVIAAKGVPHG